MRLIDADRLLSERMMSTYYHLPNGDIAIPIIDIKHAPTVDAVEVVRCEKCKWWHIDGMPIADKHFCHNLRDYVKPDFYCGKAERRQDEAH